MPCLFRSSGLFHLRCHLSARQVPAQRVERLPRAAVGLSQPVRLVRVTRLAEGLPRARPVVGPRQVAVWRRRWGRPVRQIKRPARSRLPLVKVRRCYQWVPRRPTR
ncbi:MAG: hypothetical protein K2X97_04310 [Mycobacteriaceae bacterium]|nr:hypothetical protein [Mycobacteriaceae bacterium]